MLAANLCANARYAVPGGLPVTLSAAGETVVGGVLPKGFSAVMATIAAVRGVTPAGDGSDPTDNTPTTATVRLALYAAPTTVGGSDGLQVGETSEIAGLGAATQNMGVSVPDSATTAPATYVWRLWIEQSGTNGVEISDLQAV